MQQRYYDPKTGLEKKPSYDGAPVKAEKPIFDLDKEAGVQAAPKAPVQRPRASDNLVDRIVKAVADLITKPEGSSQPQMEHEDAEKKKINAKGAPLSPNAKLEKAASYDGQASERARAPRKSPPPSAPKAPMPDETGQMSAGVPPKINRGSRGAPPPMAPPTAPRGMPKSPMPMTPAPPKGAPPIQPPMMPPQAGMGSAGPGGPMGAAIQSPLGAGAIPVPGAPGSGGFRGMPHSPMDESFDGMKATMHEFKEGKLHSGSKTGPKVKNRKQAIAIGLSEARKKGN